MQELHQGQSVKIFKSFISGGLAGIISKTMIAPVERIKYLYVTTERIFTYRGFFEDLFYIVKQHGFLSLWRGNLMNVARIFPYAAIDFSVFDGLRGRYYINDNTKISKLILFSCGAVGGIAATISTTPIQFVRLRLAMERQKFSYEGTTNAFKIIYKNEGILGFYKGFYASLIGVTIYHGFYFFIFTTIKQKLAEIDEKKYNRWYFDFMIGAVSAFGQVLSYPFDILRKRMQGQHLRIQKGQIPHMHSYNELCDTIMKNQKGIKGFYKGFTLNMIKSPMGLATVWTLKNTMNRHIDSSYNL